jgi:uncharacterized membrane protein
MSDGVLFVLILVEALGGGLMAGVFFAFSAFVMKAVARLPPAQGIAAMQSINVAAITPAFMGALFGTAALCVVIVVASLSRWRERGSFWLLVGSLLYFVSAIGVTMAFNVPRNNALAAAGPDSAGGDRLWVRYVASWTAWNHVRTAACLAAAASLSYALL